MQVATAIATSALTAAIVTAALTAFLRHVFDQRLLGMRHGFDQRLLEMEKELGRVYGILQEIDKQRRQTFQHVAARVRRVRNKAKEIVERDTASEEQVNAFRDETSGLDDDLSDLLLILQEEGLYREVHAFKNEARGLVSLFEDLVSLRLQSDEEQVDKLRGSISESYEELDRQYFEIIDHLTARASRTTTFAPSRKL